MILSGTVVAGEGLDRWSEEAAEYGGLFIQMHGSAEDTRPALLALAPGSTSSAAGQRVSEHLVVAVPDDREGTGLGDLLTTALPGCRGLASEVGRRCHPLLRNGWLRTSAAASALLGPADASEEFVRRVLTRQDVPWLTADGQRVDAQHRTFNRTYTISKALAESVMRTARASRRCGSVQQRNGSSC